MKESAKRRPERVVHLGLAYSHCQEKPMTMTLSNVEASRLGGGKPGTRDIGMLISSRSECSGSTAIARPISGRVLMDAHAISHCLGPLSGKRQ